MRWPRPARAAAWLAAATFYPALALAQIAASPGATRPALPARGPTVESLVPGGWTVEQQHHADFNRDGRPDVLLLLRAAGAGDGTPPRILLVALATAKPSGYALSAANVALVPRDQSGALEDPMADGEITVRPGGFDLKLGMMPAVGSYLAAIIRYRFRYEDGCFRLIGYDRAETHRATLDTRDVSVNFLTGVVLTKTGNAQSTAEGTPSRSRLQANPRRCLPDLGDGWRFDPLS